MGSLAGGDVRVDTQTVLRTAGGQATLTLTAGPEVFGGWGEQVLTVNAVRAVLTWVARTVASSCWRCHEFRHGTEEPRVRSD